MSKNNFIVHHPEGDIAVVSSYDVCGYRCPARMVLQSFLGSFSEGGFIKYNESERIVEYNIAGFDDISRDELEQFFKKSCDICRRAKHDAVIGGRSI